MSEAKNDTWQNRVRDLLSEGFGVHDISLILNCSVADVRREVEIYRLEGRIKEIVRGK